MAPENVSSDVTSVDTARAAQLAHHGRLLEKYGGVLRGLEAYAGAAQYVPPTDTKPSTWQGIAQYCAVMHRAIWENERHALLTAGKGPFYCPTCELRPEKGWKALGCFDCAWGTIDEPGPLMADALRLARDLAKPFDCSHCGGEFRRGESYLEHFGVAA